MILHALVLALSIAAVVTPVLAFHELGHWVAFRLLGFKVSRVAVGVGPTLFSRSDAAGCLWTVSLLPLVAWVAPEDAFGSARPWRRIACHLAGPAANFLLAFGVLAWLYASAGRMVDPPSVAWTSEAAAAAGARVGDVVESLAGEPVRDPLEYLVAAAYARPPAVDATLRRGGERVAVRLDVSEGAAGADFGLRLARGRPVALSLADAASYAASDVAAYLRVAMAGLASAAEGGSSLSGPLGMAEQSGRVAAAGLSALLAWMALLSVFIGAVNLVPVPVLDGGQAAIAAFEWATGFPFRPVARVALTAIGAALVFALMAIGTLNDLVSIMGG
jgi:regulator of sigma E protease